MPEGPEVETIRIGVAGAFGGKRIQEVLVTGARSVRRQVGAGSELASRLTGKRMVAVRRRGKYLMVDLDSGDVLVAHMGMSGQLLAARTRDPLPGHTHVVIRFAGGRELRFVDPRTFGEMFVSRPEVSGGVVPELAHLGFDVLTDGITRPALAKLLAGRNTAIKTLLMDQRFVAGVGNLYADEILWAARLRPDRVASSLTPREVGKLHRAMSEVLAEAVKHRGSSLSDDQYRDVEGRSGGYQLLHNVYGREGEPCPRCGRPIVRVKSGGRSSHFCPYCQK